MALQRELLRDWTFALGESEACLDSGRPVQVPHTWSVEEAGENHVGKGWYRTGLKHDGAHGERVFLHFRGAYRDAQVSVNGKTAGTHFGSGYTPFTVEVTEHLQRGENVLTVCVDNSFSTKALPFDRSFDWANDGGLYRPVEVWNTGRARICDAQIISRPVILSMDGRKTEGGAAFGFVLRIDGKTKGGVIRWQLRRGAEDSVTPVQEETVASGSLPSGDTVRLAPQMLPRIVYWHFDAPELYTLSVSLILEDGSVSDCGEWVIGFRELKAQSGAWFFNGEKVRLPGMEWMPGSDPDIGMAERREDLERMLSVLRESNSVLTRFHWQQDEDVYAWCDRHGLMVQEEIPFWGKQPEGDPDALFPVVRQQIDEMISAHGHHPSIIAWGVGNELSAQTWPVQRYIRRACAYIREKDADRFVNYVTNTAFGDPCHDGTGEGDVLMINDYIGTWHQGFEQESAWEALMDAHPGRVFIPSEFGLCEPAFAGGDPRREEIFLEKLSCYRHFPRIAGTVYFCLNDYRTHMGEEGEGRMRRRVHGSADLLGKPKPSYRAVQREYAPLTAERTESGIRLTCRKDIPCYSVVGYLLKCEGERLRIPDLRPGESWVFETKTEDAVSILRPNGETVLSI